MRNIQLLPLVVMRPAAVCARRLLLARRSPLRVALCSTQQLPPGACLLPRSWTRQARQDEPEPQPELYPPNIMFDRRVVRGNTYASRVLPAEPAILSGSGGKSGTIAA